MISVLGAGSWGTALAQASALSGHAVHLWVKDDSLLHDIQSQKINIRYHPEILLSNNIIAKASLSETVRNSSIIILAVPSHAYRDVLIQIKPFINHDTIIVSTAKGIESQTLMLMHEVHQSILGQTFASKQYAVLSGPSFAHDLIRNLPTAVSLASHKPSVAKTIQDLLHSKHFHLFYQNDVVGVELAGALKNVIAIAAGACDGFGFGASARSALITRGFWEIISIGKAKGANPMTFMGLSGLGDLILTASTDLSRNRRVGLKLSQGLSIKDVIREIGQVAEGIRTAKSAYQLAKSLNVSCPIIEAVYQTLNEGKNPHDAIEDLLDQTDLKEISV